MHIVLSNHVRQRAILRNISFEEIISCVLQPDTVSDDPKNIGVVCHKKLGDTQLLLVYLTNDNNTITVITVIKTSQLNKYI